jgi:hypothetical protein
MVAIAFSFAAPPAAAAAPVQDAYAFAFSSIDGTPLPLEAYRGKTLLVVNTASFCGFTRQYADLQTVWTRYRERGLVVLGVPPNDFGNQEPGSEAEIGATLELPQVPGLAAGRAGRLLLNHDPADGRGGDAGDRGEPARPGWMMRRPRALPDVRSAGDGQAPKPESHVGITGMHRFGRCFISLLQYAGISDPGRRRWRIAVVRSRCRG